MTGPYSDAVYTKDPQATLDYGFDWSAWLREPGQLEDTIVSSGWTVPAQLTVARSGHTETRTTVWLAGGTVGGDHTVTNRVTTAAGRTDERTMRVVVAQR